MVNYWFTIPTSFFTNFATWNHGHPWAPPRASSASSWVLSRSMTKSNLGLPGPKTLHGMDLNWKFLAGNLSINIYQWVINIGELPTAMCNHQGLFDFFQKQTIRNLSIWETVASIQKMSSIPKWLYRPWSSHIGKTWQNHQLAAFCSHRLPWAHKPTAIVIASAGVKLVPSKTTQKQNMCF